MDEQDTAITDVSESVELPERADCLVIIHDKTKALHGKRCRLLGNVVRIGRRNDSEVVLEEEGVSRAHARLEYLDGHWVLMDVGSLNGTLLNDELLTGTSRLRNGDRIKIGSVIFKYLSGADVESEFLEEIYEIAITDHLTQLPNRRRFDEQLQIEFVRARRHERQLSLVLFDVDLFKHVNDEYGHQAGDEVLMAIGRIIRSRVRGEDLPARVGGEEFAILMPETSIEGARALAEALRRGIAEHVLRFGEIEVRVTISAGCATLRPTDMLAAQLYSRVDERLYEAKAAGRNCVKG
jgi:two-component system, cell cycle response regulator